MVQIIFNKSVLDVPQCIQADDIHDLIRVKWKLKPKEYYLLRNGRPLTKDVENDHVIHIVPTLCGGKGGFGSMLRAIGAQIEKTTNREACRDLSGRRLRDINEEKRLKAWIDQQAAREQEAADKRQKKLERLCEKPMHKFDDDKYFEEREKLPEQLEDAVAQGMQAAASTSSGTKRKHEPDDVKKKKKRALWVDDALDDLSSGSDSSSDEETEAKPESTSKEST